MGKNKLIKSVTKSGRVNFVVSIEMIDISKVKGKLLYKCIYVDNGVEKETHIIADNITCAMDKLGSYVGMGIPSGTMNWILSNEKNTEDAE